MSKGFSHVVRRGYEYMQIWPMQPALFVLFRECQVIRLTRLALNVLPPLAIFSVIVQYQMLASEYWPAALSFAILMLSIPVQGLIWLGVRSEKALPPALMSWYNEISDKMREQGMEVVGQARPTYRDMALLLKQAFGKLDKASLQRWF